MSGSPVLDLPAQSADPLAIILDDVEQELRLLVAAQIANLPDLQRAEVLARQSEFGTAVIRESDGSVGVRLWAGPAEAPAWCVDHDESTTAGALDVLADAFGVLLVVSLNELPIRARRAIGAHLQAGLRFVLAHRHIGGNAEAVLWLTNNEGRGVWIARIATRGILE